MPPKIAGIEVKKVRIVDDDPSARDTMSETVVDAAFEALPAPGPLGSLSQFLEASRAEVDAVVSDHRLAGPYAEFNGAEAVASLYKIRCPAVLCTRWDKADIDSMREYLRYIPSLIASDYASPESIADGFERCIKEFKDDPVPSRKPWRTLVRVESVDLELKPQLFFVAVTGWESKEIVRLPLDLIPESSKPLILPGYRFFAQVNKGAERSEELYFSDFEFPSRS